MRSYMIPIAVLAAPVLALCVPSAVLAEEQAKPASADAELAAAKAKMNAIQRHVDAYRTGDLDRFVATFTHDAVVRADGYVAMGREQIRAMYALNFAPGAPSLKVYDSGLAGENVFLSAGYVLDSGEEMCCSYSEYEVRDGKVSFLVTSSG